MRPHEYRLMTDHGVIEAQLADDGPRAWISLSVSVRIQVGEDHAASLSALQTRLLEHIENGMRGVGGIVRDRIDDITSRKASESMP